MASTSPTFAELQAMWTAQAVRVNTIETWFAATYEAKETAILAGGLETDYPGPLSAAVLGDRAAITATLDPSALAQWGDPLLAEFDRLINGDDTGWRGLFDYMIAQSETVNRCEDTYASMPSCTGTGDGEILRLSVDEEGEVREGWWPDVYKAVCTLDTGQLGYSFAETFELRGKEAAKDEGNRTGSGVGRPDPVVLDVISELDSSNYVKNAGFDTISGITAPTASTETVLSTGLEFTGWTVATPGAAYASIDVRYRQPPQTPTHYSIRFTANNTASQLVTTVNNSTFDPDTPYVHAIRVYRKDSCDGTLTLTFGGVSRAVTMSTLSDDAWNTVYLVSGGVGQNSWRKSFNANSMTVSYALASRTTGSLYLDGGITAPMTLVGGENPGRGTMGHYVAILAGQTPFVRGDYFTWTDTAGGTRGVVQEFARRAGYGYLPSATGGAETWSDT